MNAEVIQIARDSLEQLRDAYHEAQSRWRAIETPKRWEALLVARKAYHDAVDALDAEEGKS